MPEVRNIAFYYTVRRVIYYNRIDMGIFLCFIELCLEHENIYFERMLFCDDRDEVKVLSAKYRIIDR